MKRFYLLALTLALAALLAACHITPGATARPPAQVQIAGASALYLQSSTTAARALDAPDGAALYTITATGTGPAVWTDAAGNPVDVTVDRTLALTPEYLLMQYTSAAGTECAVVTVADGTLRPLARPPDAWDHIRVRAGSAYWISGGAICRTDLASLAVTDMSQGDRINGGSLIFLDASDNVHTLYLVNGMIDPANQIRIYYADGSPYDSLGWGSPDAYLFCGDHIEDEASGALYRIRSGASGLVANRYTLDETGLYIGADQVLDASLTEAHEYIAPEAVKPYLGNVAWADEYRAAVVAVDAAGDISAVTVRTASAMICDRPKQLSGGKLYVAYADRVAALDLATGAETTLANEAGVTDLEVVGDTVFLEKADGTYMLEGGTVSLYSSEPVEVKSVMQ